MVANARAPIPPPALPVALLGIPFDPVTIPAAIDAMAAAIADRRPRQFATANVDFLVKARRDPELRRILLEADCVLCDGTPLVWASRWLGNRLPGRAAGSDLVPELLARAAERGWRTFLLGGAPGVAAEAARRIEAAHPGIPAVGHYAPPFRPFAEMDHADIVARVREAAPDILLVSFGCPKQEKWIAAHRRTLGVPVCMGVGATVDFLAGRVRRAPPWMRRSGIEWGFRLACEPRRLFRRYAEDVVHFFPALWRQRRSLSPPRLPGARSPAPELRQEAFGLRVGAGSALDRGAVEGHWPAWSQALQADGHCVLDLQGVGAIDSTGVALLGWWQKRLASRRRNLILFRPSAVVRRALEQLRVIEHFVVTDEAGPARIGRPPDRYPEP